MRTRTGSFAYDNAFKTAHGWECPHWYHSGDRVKWFGMLLRCQVDHYAGDAAQHPWDPGWGWGDGAATTWLVLTPEFLRGEAEDARAFAESFPAASPVPEEAQ